MRKIFIDCGVREGDAIAAFLGDQEVGGGEYYNRLMPRDDAHEFSFIGFESPDFKFKEETRQRFAHLPFELKEQLVWIFDGSVEFDTDGESYDCRLLEVSRTENVEPWRHPNPLSELKLLPCIDLAAFVMDNFNPDDYLVLKLDIEGAEYDVLQRMIETNAINWLNELYAEYHWWGKVSLREQIEEHIRGKEGLHYRNDWP
jgi:FkbM family methyltransferase